MLIFFFLPLIEARLIHRSTGDVQAAHTLDMARQQQVRGCFVQDVGGPRGGVSTTL